MSFAQKDRLDRIQHILLLTTEKISSKTDENDEIRAFCESQTLIKQQNRWPMSGTIWFVFGLQDFRWAL